MQHDVAQGDAVLGLVDVPPHLQDIERLFLVGRAADRGDRFDVLVDFADDADLFDLVGLGLFLEEKLGRKVDVVPRRALRKELRDRVLKEVVTA